MQGEGEMYSIHSRTPFAEKAQGNIEVIVEQNLQKTEYNMTQDAYEQSIERITILHELIEEEEEKITKFLRCSTVAQAADRHDNPLADLINQEIY